MSIGAVYKAIKYFRSDESFRHSCYTDSSVPQFLETVGLRFTFAEMEDALRLTLLSEQDADRASAIFEIYDTMRFLLEWPPFDLAVHGQE
jgi:hypothetical protein